VCGFERTGLLHLGFIDVSELKWNLKHVDVNLVKQLIRSRIGFLPIAGNYWSRG
jgi:hypothetical protein